DCASRSTACASDTSTLYPEALLQPWLITFTVSCTDAEISIAKTCAPSFANICAEADPMPVLAPVTTAILFSNRLIYELPLSFPYCSILIYLYYISFLNQF